MEVPGRRRLLFWERLRTAPSSWPWRETNSVTHGPKDAPRNRPEVATDPMDYPAARRTLLRLKKHVPRLLELLSTMPGSRRLSETWLETADVALGGKPDLIAISPDNLAIVIDYKSGLVSDDEGVKSVYIRQLLFYGALVYECLQATPVMLALLSLREGVVQVEPSPEGMAEVATLARAARLEFNERVPGPQPANASEENCQWCRYAARCGAFWQAVEPHWASSVGDCRPRDGRSRSRACLDRRDHLAGPGRAADQWPDRRRSWPVSPLPS